MTTWISRTVFDGADETQLYTQKRLNVKSPRSKRIRSKRRLSPAGRRAVFPCKLYRLMTTRTFGKTAAIGKLLSPHKERCVLVHPALDGSRDPGRRSPPCENLLTRYTLPIGRIALLSSQTIGKQDPKPLVRRRHTVLVASIFASTAKPATTYRRLRSVRRRSSVAGIDPRQRTGNQSLGVAGFLNNLTEPIRFAGSLQAPAVTGHPPPPAEYRPSCKNREVNQGPPSH